MYGKCGDLFRVCQVFVGIFFCDVVFYNIMFGLYVQKVYVKECFGFFGQMFLEGILFDKVIYINLFDVFIMFFMLDEGKRIYKFIVEEGLNLDI